MNSCNFTGRFTSNPELKTTKSGTTVCSFTLAVDRPFASKDGDKVDFIDFVAWRQNAEFIGKYFTKGRIIAVTGSLQTRSYEDKNGNRRKAVEVVVDHADFCDSTPTGDFAVIEDDGGELPF